MRLKHWLIGLVVLIVAVVVAGIAILKSQDFNQYKALIAEKVKEATGRDLTLAGDVELVISLSPALAVNDVTFSNAPWGTRPELLKMKRLEAQVRLIPLLSGNVEVNRIVLKGADILLETNDKGQGNWVFNPPAAASTTSSATSSTAPSGGGAPTTLPVVHSVRIEDSQLLWTDGVTKQTKTIVIKSFTASADSGSSPIEIALEGSYNENPITAKGTIGAVGALLANQAFPIDVTAEAGGAKIALKGAVAKPMTAEGVAVALSVEGNSLADLNAISGATLPPLGPYSLAGNLSNPSGVYKVEQLQLKMGSSSLTGDASVAMGGKKPNITANLAAAVIDLKDFGVKPAAGGGASSGTTASTGAANDGRVFPADPLPFDGLGAADATIHLTAQKFIKDPVTLENLALDLLLQASKLTIKNFQSALGGGTFAMSAEVDGAKTPAPVALKIDAKQVEVGTLLQTLSVSDILQGGKADLAVDVTGAGNSVREIMAGLNGNTNLAMGEGHINNRFAKILLSDLFQLIATGGSGESSNLNCFVSKFDIKKGLATSTGLVLDTNGASIVGSGDINLATEKLKLHMDPRAKQTNLANLAIPVNIGGTMASPSVTPDAAALAEGIAGAAVGVATGGTVLSALAGVAGTGAAGSATTTASSGGNPCVAALNGGTDAGATGTQPSTPSSTGEQLLKDPGKALEDTGGTLKNLLP
ncbi:cell envelope biogenesis protein AsmA [Hypericibacter adhaerens]|uniref:Cell envelope biogenesis protein AsmA n=1 Tax=Hypericibacter adhaerens TaxID=2602016 RepID=A0A5J6MXL1_9PROT|nr:AsmA family protein [Hypericibacter adhaerens]QEX21914.1 cell envelope biogenesis protein AsmA [Hypericibacter adhaerens]